MEIYLKNKDTVIKLPVLPSEFSIETEQNIEEVNIQALGSINLVGKRKADSLLIESIFPAQTYDFIHGEYEDPYDLCDKIRQWKDDGDIIDVNITETSFGESMLIELFSFGENDRSRDVSFSLSLREYRKIGTKRVTKKKKKATYTCKSGDTFYTISRKYTGSSSSAEKIAKANKLKVSSKLKAGQKVVVTYEA